MNKVLDTREDVKNFMVAGDQTVVGFSEQSDLYLKLITEELIHEFLKEYDKKNLVGIADGIADSIVVIEGFCHSLGLDLNNIWESVNNSNLTTNESLIKYELDISGILLNYADLRENYLYSKYNKYKTSDAGLELYLVYIIRHLLAVSVYLNLPIQEVWDEVARSNSSKISENGKVIKNEFGKIQKPSTFSPADIESILNKHGLV